ncbi:hypothetical protein ACHAXH_001714 [Discostella pseudostelligera]
MIAFRPIFLALAITAAVVTAFAPSSEPQWSSSTKKSTSTIRYAPMKRVGLASAPRKFINKMATDPTTEDVQKLREEVTASAGAADGTVYDDEPMLEPIRDNVSNSMKERLMREASVGLDSEKSQTNVILYVSVAVAILVALAGQGILY